MRFLFILLSALCTPLFAHVIQTDSFERLEQSLSDFNTRDLVLFDCEKTLLSADDALLQSCGKKCLRARLVAQNPSLSPSKVEALISLVLLQRKVSFVDPQALKIIKQLQNRGIRVFVLTTMRTGSYGYIPQTEQWRLQELSALGYDFRAAFPKIHRLDFQTRRSCPCPPVFVDGLLCSGSLSKGEALSAFFKKTGLRPRRLIFVDNAADHHKSVEKEARRLKIPYLGYHYTGALVQEKEVDEEIAAFQIRYLIENALWLSDAEVRKLKGG
ncbi:MAG: hypothetical protein S4CHLAM2_01690 [Chlamydiales bacterium]|nr:hypothetical protein [Chlamydiales bacterium]